MRGEALEGDGCCSPRGNNNKLCRDREKWRVKNTWDCVRRWRDRGRKVSHPCKNNPCVHQLCMHSPPHWVSTPQADLSVTLKTVGNSLSLSLHTHHSLQPNYKLSSSLVHPPYWKSISICLTRLFSLLGTKTYNKERAALHLFPRAVCESALVKTVIINSTQIATNSQQQVHRAHSHISQLWTVYNWILAIWCSL